MALQKTKEHKGFSGSYWRILQFNTNYDRDDAVVTMGLYKNATTRNDDPNAVLETYTFDLSEEVYNGNVSGNDNMKNVSLGKIYSSLKTMAAEEQAKIDAEEDGDEDLAYFSDAEDV